ncbi:CAP domain-containing protein [Acetilactobacillus jinshanensis]|uniref:SCP domain-containing protein n=1 Tax=Acetilactobacillus jinshanensis TaxID=1720083 RepID=A0A4P6ZLM5_9LACO|nr:hypothetical protein [Acetilactobacillus jinshanensis]QBP18457.1 hypothetical protein ELX58_04755 [Acetilactobacillus jinshanensis]URL61328.1 CAP domain-containing protein [uncultured bacterium]
MSFKRVIKSLLIFVSVIVMLVGFGAFAKSINVNANHTRTSVIISHKHRVRHSTKSLNQRQYYRLLVLFHDYNDSCDHQQLRTDQKRINVLLAHNWCRLSSFQFEHLILNYDVRAVLTSKYNRRQFNLKIRHIKSRLQATNQVHRLKNQGSTLNNAIRTNLIKDINSTRKRHGLRPLIIDNAMQSTANYRNRHLQYAYENPDESIKYEHLTKVQFNVSQGYTENWIHGFDNHTDGESFLLKHHYGFNGWGENASDWFVTNYHDYYSDGTLDKYIDNTPYNIAYDANDDIMNHDSLSNNGHRENELDPDWRYLGVGISYDKIRNLGTLNEQFAD